MKIRAKKAGDSAGQTKSPHKVGVKIKRRKGTPLPPEDGRLRRGQFIGADVNPAMKNGDFKSLIRSLFEKPSGADQTKRAKDRLAKVAMKKAIKGDYFFWSKLVDLHSADLVNEDDLAEFIERVYLVVRRHVEKLEGGREALAEIARDLTKEKI